MHTENGGVETLWAPKKYHQKWRTENANCCLIHCSSKQWVSLLKVCKRT